MRTQLFHYKQIKFKIVFIIFFLFSSKFFLLEASKIDSLVLLSQKEKNEQILLNICEELAFYYSDNDKFDSAYFYIDQSIELARKIQDNLTYAKMIGIKGKVYRHEGKFEKSKQYLIKAYDLARELDDKTVLMSISNDLGVTYRRLTEDDKAIIYHLEALKLAVDLNDEKHIARASNSLGIIYTYQGQYDEALKNFNRALEIEKKRDNYIGIAINLNSLAWIYELKEDYKKAIDYYKKSLDVNRVNDNMKGVIICYNDLGKVYHKIGEYKLSLEYYTKTLEFNKKQNDKRYIARSYIYLGEVYRDLGDVQKSLTHLKEGLNYALQVESKRLIMEAYEQLSKTYEKSNKKGLALNYFKLYNHYRDSVQNDEKSKQIIEMQTKYETERKEQENILLKNKNELNETLIQRQRMLVFGVIAILVLISTLVFVLLRSRRNQKKAIQLLKKQKDEIVKQSIAIHDQANELEKAINTKNRFFSIIAHDLINPFNAIIGYSNLLKSSIEKLPQEKITEYVELINQTSSQTHELLINLLEWSMAQTNSIEFEPQDVIINKLITENIELLSGQAKSKKIALNFEAEKEVMVRVDVNMIQTVLRNLISNAIKFTRSGSVEVIIVQEEEFCKVIVKDTGIGISEQTLENLFKIDKAISTKGTSGETGTGIGLILCKEFVEKNGGEIKVKSNLGEGSEFTFTLVLSK